MIKLLNSAMMPAEGHYTLQRIEKTMFCGIVQDAHGKGNLQSYIGYQDNIDLIAKWTGITLPFSRETTTMEAGDALLIMKLKYRVGDPAMKGKKFFNDEDFEFFFCNYVPIKGGKN